MNNITFSIIKPNAVKSKFAGKIIDEILQADFEIIALKKTRFTKEQALTFYGIHSDKPFFDSLIEFITSGPVYVLVLRKDKAIEKFRNFIGHTDPAKVEHDKIRYKYGKDITMNAIHGSDSDENAKLEASYFFSEFERV
ncbi:MAG: nucleoside-diphosphate kinase [Bacteroidota bacterium]|nr:nucleoside-diphosphate kinase [Bacteroidota bacterium]